MMKKLIIFFCGTLALTACGNGIDKKALLAGINSSEFRFREADYGSYPKGLMYGIDIMDSWLYGEGDPFAYVKQLDIYKELRDAVESDYYEKLVQKYQLEPKLEILNFLYLDK